jgi:outer membrane receptor protein involved in Fe transport
MVRHAFSPAFFTGLSLAVFLTAPIGSLHAQATGDAAASPPVQLDEFVVAGRATDLVGIAETPSEGSVGYVELEGRPFLRRGELLEVVPGVVITQHSGDGKANQYFLRGFNLDHGTDFSINVDGMPVNMRSHAHGQGYADLNFIIPEFVQSVDYSKGPFTVETGDFSAAGAASFQLFKVLPQAFAKIEIGDNQYARLVAGDTFTRAGGEATTVGFEATHNNGPWDLDENFQRFSGLVRQSWNDGSDREYSLTALGYGAKWNSTDQVPLRAVETGLIDRFGNIDPTDGGDTARASLSFDALFKGADATTHFTAYAIYYQLNLFSDFTYFLDDPVNGDQFNQRDRRGVFGANLENDRTVSFLGRKLDAALGAQLRYDTIDLALDHTARRQLVNVIRQDHVNEGSAGLYAKGTVHWTDWLRIEAGLRGDFYSFDVDSDNPLNSGHRTAAIASPKLGFVFGPWGKTEFYVNAGLGFHSNDARGTTITVSPTDGTPVAADSPLVRSHGLEAGVRTSAIPGLVSTVSVWALDLDSELVFSGDAGDTEASGATRRYGVEFANYYKLNPWVALDADVSFTHARYRDGAPADYVANSISTVVTGGIVAGKSDGLFGALRLRYFGPQPITEDNSVREPSSTTFNARIGWRNRGWEIALDVLNLLNRENDDIAYYYTSRLPGEPAAGVDDTHFHPAEPREFRLSVMRKF